MYVAALDIVSVALSAFGSTPVNKLVTYAAPGPYPMQSSNVVRNRAPQPQRFRCQPLLKVREHPYITSVKGLGGYWLRLIWSRTHLIRPVYFYLFG